MESNYRIRSQQIYCQGEICKIVIKDFCIRKLMLFPDNYFLYCTNIIILITQMGNTATNTTQSFHVKLREPTEKDKVDLEILRKRKFKEDCFDLSHEENIYDKCELLLINNFMHFKELSLSYNIIGLEVCALLSKFSYETIEILNLDNNFITCECMAEICKPSLINLKMLYLNHNRIKNEGAKILSKTNLSRLITLDLSHNQIDDQGIFWVSKTNFIQITTLFVAHNKFTESGAKMLATNGQWHHLAYIDLQGNDITDRISIQKLKFNTRISGFRIQI